MKLWFAKGCKQNGLPLDLLASEQPEDGVGYGHLPLLESVSTGTPKFPAHDDLGEELFQMLSRNNPTNNVNATRLRMILDTGSFPNTATGTIQYEWPEFVRDRQREEPQERENVNGMFIFITFFRIDRI